MARRKFGQSSTTQSRRRQSLQCRQRRQTAAGVERLERRDLMALTFNFTFAADGTIGFNHPTLGTARKAALNEAATEFGSWFPNYTKTIDVLVSNENQGVLGAHASGAFIEQGPDTGFEQRVPMRKILGPAGAPDPNGAAPDGELSVTWEENNPSARFVWELGDDVQSPTEADFKSAMIHELVHILGFESGIKPNGGDTFEDPTPAGQPGLWDVFDQFVADGQGRLIDSNFALNKARWDVASIGELPTSGGLFFDGPNAKAANGGQPVMLHSQNPFVEGSSVSHLRINTTQTDATHLMLFELRDGQVVRRLHPVEVAIMKDLGYDMSLPPPSIVASGSTIVIEGRGNSFQVQLSARPPTNVVIDVSPSSSDLSVNTQLTFTPVNWNEMQTVGFTATDNSLRDGNRGVSVNLIVNTALSDPLYHGISKAVEVFINDDEPDPLKIPGVLFGTGVGSATFVFEPNGEFKPNGDPSKVFDPFGGFIITPTLGVSVAYGDVTNDGVADYVTGLGAGLLPLVKVFNSGNQSGESTISAFGSTFTGGVNVATGDINADGVQEVIAAQASLDGEVRFFSLGLGFFESLPVFEPFGSSHTGGVTIATADVDGDGNLDLITGMADGGAGVKVFKGPALTTVLLDTTAFPNYTGGVNVAGGDFDGDGKAEIVVAKAKVSPEVKIIPGSNLTGGTTATIPKSSDHLGQSFGLGSRVAVGRLRDSRQQVLVVTGDFGNYCVYNPFSSTADFITAGTSVRVAGSIPEEFASLSFFLGRSTVAVDNTRLATSVNLASNKPNSLAVGESATITATITENSTLTPRGFVTFTVDGVAQSPVAVVDGKATVNVSKTSVGEIKVTAKYSGDANFAGSSSAELKQTVNKGISTTSLTVPSPKPFDQQVQLNVSISAVGVTPTGTVVFKVNGVAKPAVTVVNAAASLTLPAGELPVGTHTIVAEYSGDAFLQASVSSSQSVTVTKGTSQISVVPQSPTVNFGGAINLTVKATPPQTVGTITIKQGEVVLETQPVSAENTFSLILGAGTKQLVAEFSGNDSFASATSGPVQVVVNKVTPALSLALAAETVNVGRKATFTATINAGDLPAAPTGQIVFKENQTVLGSVPIASGKAVLEKTDFAVGFHTITAEYQGDDNFLTVTSGAAEVEVVTPDIELKLLTPPTTAPAGGNVVYMLEITNHGALDVGVGRLTTNLPEGLVLDKSNSSPDLTDQTNDGTTTDLGFNIGTLPALSKTIRTITGRIANDTAAGTTFANTFSITPSPLDDNLTNNQVAVTTTVIREADVSVRVQAGPDPVVAGRKVSYVITVKNNGPSLANNVRIEHQFPAGLTLDAAGTDSGFSTFRNNAVRLILPSLANGVERKFVVTANVAATVPAGTVTSTTDVLLNETDPLPGNNRVSTVSNVTVLQATNNVIANGDASAGDVNANQIIPVSQLLANDLNPVNLTSITQPANGSVTFDPAGQNLIFTPNPGFAGRSEFQYEIEGSIPELLVLAITAPDLSTSQMALTSASWSVDTATSNPSSFNFTTDLNEASPAIIDALARGVTLPSVTVLTRRSIGSGSAATTKETLRWTLFDVNIKNFLHDSRQDSDRPVESYAAEFKRMELNVVSDPDVIGSRYQAGFDFTKDSAFAANQFAKLPTKYPLSVADVSRQLATKNLMQVGNLGGVEIAGFQGGVSNSADFDSSGRASIGTVSVTLPPKPGSDQVVADLLAKGLNKTSLGDVTLTRGFSPSSDLGEASTTWKLVNARIERFTTAMDTTTNLLAGTSAHFFELSFDRIEVTQTKLKNDGTFDSELRSIIPKTGNVTAAANFGRQNLRFGRNSAMKSNHELRTESGDLEIESLGISVSRHVRDDVGYIDIHTIVVKRPVDVGSPKLMAAAATGTSIGNLEYENYLNNSSGDTTLRWQFEDVIVSSYSVDVSGESPIETVTLLAKKATQKIDMAGVPVTGEGPEVVIDQVAETVSPPTVTFPTAAPTPRSGMFLEIDGARIPVNSAEWMANERSAAAGSGFNVEIPMNEFSTRLFALVASGQELPRVAFSKYLQRGPEVKLEEKFAFENVVFNSLGQVAKADGGLPVESYQLSFSKFEFSRSDGTARNGEQKFAAAGYDFATDKTSGNFGVLSTTSLGRPEGLSLLVTKGDGGGQEIAAFTLNVSELSQGGRPTAAVLLNSAAAASRFLGDWYKNRTFDEISIARTLGQHVGTEWRLRDAKIEGVSLEFNETERPDVLVLFSFRFLETVETPLDNRGGPGKAIKTTIDLDTSSAKGNALSSSDRPGIGTSLLSLNGVNIEVKSASTSLFAASDEIVSGGYAFRVSNADEALPGLLASAANGTSFTNVLLTQFSNQLNNGRFSQTEAPLEIAKWELGTAKMGTVSLSVTGRESPELLFQLQPSLIAQTLNLEEPIRGEIKRQRRVAFDFVQQDATSELVPFIDLERIPKASARVSLIVSSGYVDGDGDLIDDSVEKSAPNRGDGNKDGKADDQQRNVASQPHPVTGNFVTLAAPEGQNLNNVAIITPGSTPPRDIDFRVGLLQYELTNAPANSGATTITIFIEGTAGFNSYYKFGPTKDNPTPHYYPFLYNGETGAQIFSDRIVVHLRDGKRGDDDLTVNGKIVDPGAPAINNSSKLFHNPNLPEDVNDNGVVEPIDALLVINDLNASGARTLPTALALPLQAYSMLDVDGDNQLQPLDALLVINFLNRGSGQGEPSGLDAEAEVGLSLTQLPASQLVGSSNNSEEELGEPGLTSVITESQESLAGSEAPPANALGSSLPTSSLSETEEDSDDSLAAWDDYFSQFQSL